MPNIDLSPEDFRQNPLIAGFAPMKVMAVMLHPTNASARDRLLLSIGVRAAYKLAEGAATGVQIQPAAIPMMAQASDPFDLIDQATEPVIIGFKKLGDGPSFTGGTIAGLLLLKVLHLHGQDATTATLDRARTEVSGELQQIKAKTARPKNLKDPWTRYRSVAHLWAARVHWDKASQTDEGVALKMSSHAFLPSQPAQLAAFLALAETFRERGERIKHKNAATPILKADQMWRLPPSLAHLRLPELGSNS
jgi:hypothetical protein